MVRWVGRVRKLNVGTGENKGIADGLNKLVLKVTGDVEQYHYNTAIAAMMSFVNLVEEKGRNLSEEQMGVFVRLLAPFAPHLAEEMWERMGGEFSVHQQAWPEYDPKLVVEEKATIVVQVNGKVRERLVTDKETDQKTIEQMAVASDKVKRYIEGRKYRVVFVPGKILNLVINA